MRVEGGSASERVVATATFVAFAFMLLVALGARASEAPEQFDARILAELAAANPAAAALMAQANEARAREDWKEAARLYGEVHALAPTYPHALRRQGAAELEQGHRSEAIRLATEAVALDRTSENLAGLAGALVESRDGQGAIPRGDLEQARDLARESVRLDPDAEYPWVLLVVAGLRLDDAALREEALGRLRIIEPDAPTTHYYAALHHATAGDYAEARSELAAARALGLPPDAASGVAKAIDEADPPWHRALRAAPWILGAWLGSMVVLFVLGTILSGIALSVAKTPPRQASVASMPAGLRWSYRIVLWLSCLYYWISLPILLVGILALGAGGVYFFIRAGHVPVKLVLILAMVVLVSVFAVLKSLFVRVSDRDPGERLDVSKHPRLDAALREVATRVGTPPLDDVFLTPGTEMAVFERGGTLRQLGGSTRRCLILGAGVLEGMRLPAFKAVLAHEYGHLTNRDTAGGGFALTVRRSIVKMAEALAAGGAAAWYNPTWLFVNLYFRVFLRISQGASRLQEVMADRWAAACYGSEAFVEGLTHVIRRSVAFDARTNASLQQVIKLGEPLANLYRHEPMSAPPQAEIEAAAKGALEAQSSPYDSHPRPQDRIAWVRALGMPAKDLSAGTTDDAWTLFEDREAIERLMTLHVRLAVAENTGSVIREK